MSSRGGMQHATRPLVHVTCHVHAPLVLIMREVMCVKDDKVKKK